MRLQVVLSSAVVAISLCASNFVQTASAADMPTKAPAAPIADPAWTGWYLGLNAGGTGARQSYPHRRRVSPAPDCSSVLWQ